MQELTTFLVGLLAGGAVALVVVRLLHPVLLERSSSAAGAGKKAGAAAETAAEASTLPRFGAAQPPPAPVPALESPPAPTPEPITAEPEPPPLLEETDFAPLPLEPELAPSQPEPELTPEPEVEEKEVGRDKRQHVRLISDEPLMVTPFAGRETMAEICDVSLGGVRFKVVGLALRAGDLMHVTFNLGGESLTAVARVLRIRQLDDITAEVAAQFARLDPWAARRFEEALAERD